MAEKSRQEIVAKALWDEDSRSGRPPWAFTRPQYMSKAGHAMAALAGNGFAVVHRDSLIAVMDSLAEWANQRGEMHEGLSDLLRDLGLAIGGV